MLCSSIYNIDIVHIIQYLNFLCKCKEPKVWFCRLELVFWIRDVDMGLKKIEGLQKTFTPRYERYFEWISAGQNLLLQPLTQSSALRPGSVKLAAILEHGFGVRSKLCNPNYLSSDDYGRMLSWKNLRNYSSQVWIWDDQFNRFKNYY